jgi:uncharacterized tellurite resistance protein B-like protein
MFDHLLGFLKGPPAAPDLKTAVAVLLLEAAYRDDDFAEAERNAILRLLGTKFGLSEEEAEALLAETRAKQREMVQLHPYTHAVFEAMEPQERVGVIEMLWEVAYADGTLDAEEDALIRKVAGLIYVDDRARMLARRRVMERLGIA